MYSIGELAKYFKVTVRTIRYYEDIGLIDTGLRLKGKRYFYKETIIPRMENIIFLKSLGFKISEIQEILKHPFFVKEIMINIRIYLITLEINDLIVEQNILLSILNDLNWPLAKISDCDVLNNLRFSVSDLVVKLANISIEKDKFNSSEEIIKFVSEIKNWYQRAGININDVHLSKICKENESNEFIKIINKYFENSD